MKKTMMLLCLVLMCSQILLATIINVPADQPTIQQGLNVATEGDTVLVATGTYYENLFWPMTNGIKLLSEAGADSTIIDGSNTSTVIYIFGAVIDTTTVINGFTLQNGTADIGGGFNCLDASPKLESCVIENNEGGGCAFTNSISAVLRNNEIKENNGIGIKCEENSNLYISYCEIENNNGSGIYFHSSTGDVFYCNISGNNATYGGGIYCNNASPSLYDVTISGNSSSDHGGGIYCRYSNPSLDNVTITGNSAGSGGGIYLRDSNPSLTNVTISGNSSSGYGGGIYLGGSNPSLDNVTITGNSASVNGGGIYFENSDPSLNNVTVAGNSASNGGGGIYCYHSNLSLENVTIVGNSADYGGGIYFENSDPSLNNVTVAGNSASDGGGIYCNDSNPVVENCTITDNSASEDGDGIYTTNSSEPSIHYSNIMLNGYGIFNNDPSVMLNADNNFWGDATGPYHQFWNPGGLGDSVNQYVNPIPFLTEADIIAPPIPPYGLDTLAVGDDYITINWQNSPIGDLEGYKVYFDSDSTGFPYSETVDVEMDTTYTLTNLITGTTYYISVTCYDIDDNESWYSREIEVTPGGADVDDWNVSINDLILHQNYPNPFNPVTTISYQIQKSGNVNIAIYNIKGQLVETLVNEQQTSGSRSVTWDAKEFSSGIYLYKLTVNGRTEAVRKCLLLK